MAFMTMRIKYAYTCLLTTREPLTKSIICPAQTICEFPEKKPPTEKWQRVKKGYMHNPSRSVPPGTSQAPPSRAGGGYTSNATSPSSERYLVSASRGIKERVYSGTTLSRFVYHNRIKTGRSKHYSFIASLSLYQHPLLRLLRRRCSWQGSESWAIF
jgi:hypothetical protein